MALDITLHIVPSNDLIAHEAYGEGCVCGPRCGPAEATDGSIRWLVVHSSLDGREHRERAPRPDPGE